MFSITVSTQQKLLFPYIPDTTTITQNHQEICLKKLYLSQSYYVASNTHHHRTICFWQLLRYHRHQYKDMQPLPLLKLPNISKYLRINYEWHTAKDSTIHPSLPSLPSTTMASHACPFPYLICRFILLQPSHLGLPNISKYQGYVSPMTPHLHLSLSLSLS